MMTTTMPTTMAMTTMTDADGRARWRPGFRLRIFGGLAVLLIGATFTGIFLQRAVLRAQLAADVERAHDQEITEMSRLATGRNPETGEPFGSDVEAIFETFLRRNVPDDDEVYVTIVGDEAFRSSLSEVRLDRNEDLVAQWAGLEEGSRGWVTTAAGEVRWAATPILVEGERLGTFVVSTFVDEDRREIDDALRVEAAVATFVVLVALAIGWSVAGRMLRPVRDLTANARGLSERDLSERIPVSGDDEIAQLARTYNEMLDRLQSAFETQRRFVDDAGHELRTPITIISGHLELMGDDPEDRRETLALVSDELDRMSRMVDDLLILAKSEQPQFIDPKPTDLAELTNGLLHRASTMGDRTWRLSQIAEGQVSVDGQRLVQAALNLLRNAVEHTEVGGTIDIGTSLVGDTLHLWVRDDGPGVALEDQERLFQRFARGDASGRRRTEGAGLGLAIVRAIAEAHGGRVLLESRPGEGATFTIEVPAPPLDPRPADPSTPEPTLAPLGPPTEELDGSHPDR